MSSMSFVLLGIAAYSRIFGVEGTRVAHKADSMQTAEKEQCIIDGPNGSSFHYRFWVSHGHCRAKCLSVKMVLHDDIMPQFMRAESTSRNHCQCFMNTPGAVNDTDTFFLSFVTHDSGSCSSYNCWEKYLRIANAGKEKSLKMGGDLANNMKSACVECVDGHCEQPFGLFIDGIDFDLEELREKAEVGDENAQDQLQALEEVELGVGIIDGVHVAVEELENPTTKTTTTTTTTASTTTTTTTTTTIRANANVGYVQTKTKEWCKCTFSLWMNYSLAVKHYPQRFGNPEGARKMKRMSPQRLRNGGTNYIPHEKCGGECSLKGCQRKILTQTYSDVIKTTIADGDVDVGMFEARRSFRNMGNTIMGWAPDCAKYERPMAKCTCDFSHKTECPYMKQVSRRAKMLGALPVGLSGEKCSVENCNKGRKKKFQYMCEEDK